MIEFGKIQKLKLRDVWNNEATDFTPWLAENIKALADGLEIDLELQSQEESVGDFSLDLLAKDLGTGKTVVIENQLTPTDHDHLGKLLTYAAGFDASIVVWVFDTIREEHRQALEWLNQRTDSDTEFFGVIVEVLKIGDSLPAYNFRPIVFPNTWLKGRKTPPQPTPRAEAYRNYFQQLIDELRVKHKFTGAKVGQPQNWYSFSTGISGFLYSAVFVQGGRVRVELYIDTGDLNENKQHFDWLKEKKEKIEEEYGEQLEWERLDDKRASRISIYREGTIESSKDELKEIHLWTIEHLLRFKKIFTPWLKLATKQLHKA